MGQQPTCGAFDRTDQRINRGFSLIETVVMITVIGIVSMMTVSILFSLSTSNTGLQNENYAVLKLQNLMRQIANELGVAHPGMMEMSNQNRTITYRQIIAQSKAENIGNGVIYDPAVEAIPMIAKNMRAAFPPYSMQTPLYKITKVQNGSLRVKNVKPNFPESYAVVSAEASLEWSNNTIILTKQYFSNQTKTYTTGVLCDGVSKFSVTFINAGMVEIIAEVTLRNFTYSSTKMIPLGVPS